MVVEGTAGGELAAGTTTATGLVPTLTRTNNKTISLTGADALSNDLVFYYVQALTSAGAAAAYAPVTITAPAGAFVLNSSALEVSSTTAVTDINGYVGFVGGSNATGSIVYTVAAGTVSKTITTNVANTAAAGRYVTVTGPATGQANGELNLYSGTVTDRFGNTVADVSVTATGKLLPVAVLLFTASIVNTIFCSGAAFSQEKSPTNNIEYNKFFITQLLLN